MLTAYVCQSSLSTVVFFSVLEVFLLHRFIRLSLSPRSLPEPPSCLPLEPHSFLLTRQTRRATLVNYLPIPHAQPCASILPSLPFKESLCIMIMYTDLPEFVPGLSCGSSVKLRSFSVSIWLLYSQWLDPIVNIQWVCVSKQRMSEQQMVKHGALLCMGP